MNSDSSVCNVKTFYKYRCWSERTRSILLDRQIYFASPFDFNDPFDCGLDILCAGADNQKIIEAIAFGQVRKKMPHLSPEETLEAVKQIGDKITADHLAHVEQTSKEKVVEEITSRCGICSLSEVNDDILMWSHYANCHQGVCLEFSLCETTKPFLNLRPVTYCEDMPRVNLHELVTNEDLRKTAPWMLTKAVSWAYEREWRALEFKSGPGLKPFDAAALTGVILGCRMPEQERRKVAEVVHSSGLTTALLEARMASNQFKLEIVTL